MQRNRQRLASEETQRRLEEELDECIHQPLITKMAARLQKESVVETSEKFLQRKKEHIDAMRREIEEKERELVQPPLISDSSRFLAIKREERLCSQGIMRPTSSPGQRLYALAQHSSQKKKHAIEEQELQKTASARSANVLPASELIQLSSRLHDDAAARQARLQETRSAHLSAQDNALKQLSWINAEYSSIRSNFSRDANCTLVSPFCHDQDEIAAATAVDQVPKSRDHSSLRQAVSSSNAAELEECSPLVSDMSRLIAERLERRSGISSSARLLMPLEKDREPVQTNTSEKNQRSIHNDSANASCLRPDPKFDKWREQQLSWHNAKQLKLQEFRKQQEEEQTRSGRIKAARDVPDDLFFRKQLDKQMRHEQVLESARAAKEKQEAASLKYATTSSTAASAPAAFFLLKSTAAHEARVAARFKGDA
jgi:hypothetical protein